jgi:beta-1,4-mannosyl-glycoprotein beta-1,4-N-acetylglucosaminyltransferase
LKIFDCVTFFNEFDLLRLRIACLEDVVDHFVVVEAHQTHAGKPKPLYLSESGPADLRDHPKIVVRALDLPVGFSDWARDQAQREGIGGVLADLGAAPQDLVVVSDVDEIPERAALLRAREFLARAAERTILVFEQRLFYFRLNYELVWSRKLPWLGTSAALYGQTKSINGLRTTGRNIRGRHALGFDRGAKVFQVPRGGWHFSYLGGDEALQRKLDAHQEHAGKARRGDDTIGDLIAARRSLYPRKGLEEVWAVVERADVGLPDAAVARARVGHLFESPTDTAAQILSRVRDAGVPRRWRLGRYDVGYARRGHWPRLGNA